MVGRVIGTEDATPLSYWVALAPGRVLQLDDVVVTDRVLPNGEQVRLAGLVTEMRARYEGARFDSDVFLIQDGVLPAEVVEAASITTTRVEPEIFVPPLPGSEVRKAVGKERDAALFFDQMDKKLPIGLGRDGEPLYANLEFLDGTRGAHVNISGISGVATKTTYASFLLYSLFTSGVLGSEAINTKALIFNVKGEDLLFLDHDNVLLGDHDRERYRALGLEPHAFDSVSIYAPPRAGDANAAPDVATRTVGVNSYYWTIAEFCADELLPFVFADAEDERNQYTMVIHNVAHRLRTDGQRGRGRRRVAGRRGDAAYLRRAGRLPRRPAAGRRRRAAAPLGRPGHDARDHPGLRPPAAVVAPPARAAHPGRRQAARAPPDHDVGLEDHRRRPPQPAGPRAAVRGGRDDPARARRQGGVGHGPAAPLPRPRRAQQVRAATRARRRSRRSSSTSPSAAGRSA